VMPEQLTDIQLAVIGDIQCPGCTCGTSPVQDCERFEPHTGYGFKCLAHSAGTMMFPGGYVYLGLPKGFNRVGAFRVKGDDKTSSNIRLWVYPDCPEWNRWNVPVWAMFRDGYL